MPTWAGPVWRQAGQAGEHSESSAHHRLLAGDCEQVVQVCGDGQTIVRGVDVVAPALTGTVVGAHPGGAAHLGSDPSPVGGRRSQPVLEHDGGAARSRAVEVQTVTSDVVQGAGRGVGVPVVSPDAGLVDPADGADGQDRSARCPMEGTTRSGPRQLGGRVAPRSLARGPGDHRRQRRTTGSGDPKCEQAKPSTVLRPPGCCANETSADRDTESSKQPTSSTCLPVRSTGCRCGERCRPGTAPWCGR